MIGRIGSGKNLQPEKRGIIAVITLFWEGGAGAERPHSWLPENLPYNNELFL